MRRKLVGDRNEPAAFRHLSDAHEGFASRIGFRFLDGCMRSLAYAQLIETEFDPAIGIVLSFIGHTVTIRGRNLVELYNGLEDGAVGEIIEQHANEMATAEDETFITRLEWETR